MDKRKFEIINNIFLKNRLLFEKIFTPNKGHFYQVLIILQNLKKIPLKFVPFIILPINLLLKILPRNQVIEIVKLRRRIIYNHIKSIIKEDLDFLERQDFYRNLDSIEKMTFLAIWYQVITTDQYNLKLLLKKDMKVVIDCGGNFGFFSLYCTYLNRNVKVYCFEPVPNTFEKLNKVIKGFKVYKNIKPIKAAVGEKSGLITFEEGVASVTSKASEKGNIKADLISIDEFISKNKIKRVDLIKMDIEGYERYALNGAKETIEKFKPTLVIAAYHFPDDKKVITSIVKNICKDYEVKLSKKIEEDLIFQAK